MRFASKEKLWLLLLIGLPLLLAVAMLLLIPRDEGDLIVLIEDVNLKSGSLIVSECSMWSRPGIAVTSQNFDETADSDVIDSAQEKFRISAIDWLTLPTSRKQQPLRQSSFKVPVDDPSAIHLYVQPGDRFSLKSGNRLVYFRCVPKGKQVAEDFGFSVDRY